MQGPSFTWPCICAYGHSTHKQTSETHELTLHSVSEKREPVEQCFSNSGPRSKNGPRRFILLTAPIKRCLKSGKSGTSVARQDFLSIFLTRSPKYLRSTAVELSLYLKEFSINFYETLKVAGLESCTASCKLLFEFPYS